MIGSCAAGAKFDQLSSRQEIEKPAPCSPQP